MFRWLLPLSIFFIFVTRASALSLSLSDLPPSVDKNQEFTANINLDCACTGSSYFRGVFYYPETSTSYFGLTQNNSGAWINYSSDRTQYFQSESGSFSGQIKFKFESEKPIGQYFFKVGRYTSAADSGADWSNSLSVTVSGPTPTPVPTSIPKPSSTPQPSPTIKPPTSTIKPLPSAIQPSPTIKPLPSAIKPSIVPSPSPTPIIPTPTAISHLPLAILPSPTIEPFNHDPPPPNVASALFSGGTILCFSAAFILIRKSGKIVSS